MNKKVQLDHRFRCWDKLTKQFIYPWPNGFAVLGETTCFDLVIQALMELTPAGMKKTSLERLGDAVLTESIGIKDKNNNLLYEEDIIKWTSCLLNTVVIGKIVKVNAHYEIQGHKIDKNGMIVNKVNVHFGFFDTENNKTLEKIGTMFEDKKLINVINKLYK